MTAHVPPAKALSPQEKPGGNPASTLPPPPTARQSQRFCPRVPSWVTPSATPHPDPVSSELLPGPHHSLP